MKFTVMGAGGVGGYFGARLAAAGHEVGFVARGRHLEAMRANGLVVRSQLGDVELRPVSASGDPAAFGAADCVLFTVKSYDCETAAEAVRPALGADTFVVPLLNGIGHIEVLRRILGPGRVVGGVAHISALIEEPGVVRHFDRLQILRIGEMDNSASPRVLALREACRAAGIECPAPNDIERELWQKVAMICTLAGANCLTRLPLSACRSHPATARDDGGSRRRDGRRRPGARDLPAGGPGSADDGGPRQAPGAHEGVHVRVPRTGRAPGGVGPQRRDRPARPRSGRRHPDPSCRLLRPRAPRERRPVG